MDQHSTARPEHAVRFGLPTEGNSGGGHGIMNPENMGGEISQPQKGKCCPVAQNRQIHRDWSRFEVSRRDRYWLIGMEFQFHKRNGMDAGGGLQGEST